MALPKPIQAQVEQADAVIAAMNQPEEAPVNLAELANQPDTQSAEPQPAVATPPAPAPQPDNWEHKYKTLKGRYNSDVPRLQSEVGELKGQLQQAIAKMNELTKAPEKPKEEPKPVADPKDVEAFGEDLVSMVQRVAERMFGDAARAIREQAAAFDQRITRVEETLKGTSQTVAVTAEQAFFDRLTKLVPNWEEINANQAFLDWLGEIDPVYGQPRQAALNVAQQSLNAERAAAVFKAFAGTLPQAPKADPVGKQVTPKAVAATAPTPSDKPVLTQKQITAFYDDVRRGAFRGKEAEAQRIEAMINAAIAEGRVR